MTPSTSRTSRALLALGTAITLLLVGAAAAPAHADPVVVATASTSEYAVTLTQTSPGELEAHVVNRSATETQTFGLGATTTNATDVELLWRDAWAPLADVTQVALAPGEQTTNVIPIRTGVRYVVYRDVAAPQQVLDWRAEGRFSPLTVSGSGDTAQIQFGNPVGITPGAVRAGESPRISVPGFGAEPTAQVWMISDPVDSNLELGARPLAFVNDGGVLLGSIPVTAGTATGNVTVPAGTAPGAYTLLVGDPGDQWWPGGPALRQGADGSTTASNITIEAGAPRGATTPSPTETTVTPLDQNGATPVSFTFPGGGIASPGVTTVTTSTTGPTPTGFTLIGGGPSYFQLETTAGLTAPVLVCVAVAPEVTDASLFHFVDGSWQDITESRPPGKVCGSTDSFSPFAIGRKAGWPFTGFLAPVLNDRVNTELAGSVIPLRFRLGGDRGANVLAAGSPTSGVLTSCRVSAVPASTQAATAALRLTYVKATKTYWYVWKTDRAWAGSCRQIVLTLADGTVHRASFRFVKPTPGAVLRTIVSPY